MANNPRNYKTKEKKKRLRFRLALQTSRKLQRYILKKAVTSNHLTCFRLRRDRDSINCCNQKSNKQLITYLFAVVLNKALHHALAGSRYRIQLQPAHKWTHFMCVYDSNSTRLHVYTLIQLEGLHRIIVFVIIVSRTQ